MSEIVMTIMWAVFFIGALIIESQTAELIAVWFVPGALISMVLATCGVAEWIQWVVFGGVSAVLVLLAFTVFRKKLLKNHGKEKTDTDLLIGKTAVVIERIDNAAMTGAVKVDGMVWSAKMLDDCEYAEVGEFVEIEAISGVKLICRWK
ncbi:MAG: NfeD family protein [Ruminococcaceae bacterium]|nr:NfeD family protein [Oscillospiraceae bacterium]